MNHREKSGRYLVCDSLPISIQKSLCYNSPCAGETGQFNGKAWLLT
jgi:hypothetical protein